MRILHVLRAPVGGLFRHVLDLAAEQAHAGCDVGILADSKGDRLTADKFAAVAPLLSLGVERIAIPHQPGFGDIAAARAVVRHAKRLNVDVLHGHGAKGGAYARLAGAALRLSPNAPKIFYTPHGGSLHLDAGPIASPVLLGFERLLERATDGLIFESRFAANAYSKRIGEPRVTSRVIHNGVGPDDLVSVAPAPDATDLLFVGELRELKGVHILLDAIADISKRRPITATIVGGGPDAARIKAQARDLGLTSSVRFIGPTAAREAFSFGRLFVMPSLKESFPYAVLEAAAAGLPLIATSVGGVPEIVAGTDTRLIEAGSVNALAAAIEAALDDPEVLAARAERLKMTVALKFTVSGMSASVVDFYGKAAPFAAPARTRPELQS